MNETTVVMYTPKFVGRTENDEKVVLYESVNPPHTLHIKRPDGELWAVGMGSSVWIEDRLDHRIHLHVSCQAWTGEAIGTRLDLIAEEPIRI